MGGLKRHPAAIIAGLIIAAIAVFVYVNMMSTDVSIEKTARGKSLTPLRGGEISLFAWNIGYGGLGAESDFAADGGKHLLPPSRAVVKKNLAGITNELARARNDDVVLIEEAARSGFLTRGVNVLGGVNKALGGRDNAFSAIIRTRLMPPPLRLRHGLFTSTKLAGVKREIVSLPLEPQRIMGLWRMRYHMQVLRIPIEGGGTWVIAAVHLSAFDKGANVRLEQLRAALSFAEAEYKKGAHVILGGDWNYEFHRPDRPTTTEEKYLFWIHAFPFDELKEGWRAVYDPDTPSVRTNERPYHRNENFTTIIDGFIVSPNVAPLSVKTTDLDFQFTDHQPVEARFKAE